MFRAILKEGKGLRFSLCGCVISFLLLAAYFIPREADAQTAATQCGGLDVVFVIDQSASMRENDKNGLRGTVARYALDLLGDNSVYQCPGAVQRIAVLGFGDNIPPKIYLEPTTISPNSGQLEEWKVEKEELRKTIPDRDYLGSTDHLAGIKLGAQILKEWRANPIGSGVRKRALILITDGGPCVTSKGCTANPETSKFDTPAYMKEVEEFVNPLGGNLPFRGDGNSESVFLYIIAFRDTTSPYNYLNDSRIRGPWEKMAKDHGGALLELQAADKDTQNLNLNTVVADVMDKLLDSNFTPVSCDEPIWVDPYKSDIAIIHFFRKGSNPGVDVNDVKVRIRATRGGNVVAVFEGGQVIEGKGRVNEYTHDGPNERYVLYNPLPGKYSVEVEGADICKHLDVRQGKSNAQMQVVYPKSDTVIAQVDTAPYYDADAPKYFTVRVTQQGLNGERVPLQEDVDFPIAFVVKAVTSDENAEYKLVRNEDGTYTSETPILAQHSGTTTWQLMATAPNPRRDAEPPVTTPIEVFSEKGSFTVKPVQRFSYRILTPGSGQEFDLNSVSGTRLLPVPVDIQVELLDPSGKTADPRTILTGSLNNTFTATIVDPLGQELEQVTLRPDLNHQGFFIGQIRASRQGIAGVDTEGEYVLLVKWIGEFDALNFAPKTRQESVKFKRFAVKPVDVAIAVPANSILHEGGAGCVTGAVTSFPIQVSFHLAGAQDNNAQVSATQVLASSQGFQATLYDPQNKTETIPLQLESRPGGAVLVGAGGATLDSSGEYRVTVSLPNGVLNPRYAWAVSEKTTDLKRDDELFTNPLACRTGTGLVLLAAFAVLGVIGYVITGGPSGTILIVESMNPDSTVWGPWRLGGMPRVNRNRSSDLKKCGIKELKAMWAEGLPDENGRKGRAVRIQATDLNGNPFYDSVLEAGDVQPFVECGDIAYR